MNDVSNIFLDTRSWKLWTHPCPSCHLGWAAPHGGRGSVTTQDGSFSSQLRPSPLPLALGPLPGARSHDSHASCARAAPLSDCESATCSPLPCHASPPTGRPSRRCANGRSACLCLSPSPYPCMVTCSGCASIPFAALAYAASSPIASSRLSPWAPGRVQG